MTGITEIRPDAQISVRDAFGIDTDLPVPAFAEREDHVPEVDTAYIFNPEVTLAILAGGSAVFLELARVIAASRPSGRFRPAGVRPHSSPAHSP
jgi:hypothetical protein